MKNFYEPHISSKGLMGEVARIIRAGRMRRIPKYIKEYLSYIYIYIYKPKFFTFKGSRYKEFYHYYNKTYRNERRFEIPIIKEIIRKYKEEEILEIGNVLKHYMKAKWGVIDKYEVGEGVINKDILDYKGKKKYNLIISISTIEHIGKDEIHTDNKKCIEAIKKIRKMLSNKGKFVFTFLEHYNDTLSKYVLKSKNIEKQVINVKEKGNLIIAEVAPFH